MTNKLNNTATSFPNNFNGLKIFQTELCVQLFNIRWLHRHDKSKQKAKELNDNKYN